MDPRHPEQALSRMRELMKQYDRIENDIRNTAVATNLGGLEREGSLVIQEICLVAPRLHEAMMQASRQRRNELSRGFFPEIKSEALEKPKAEVVESYVAPDQAETEVVEPKPRKKKTTKKKAKKAE